MTSKVYGFRSFFLVWIVVVALMIVLAAPSRAGDGTVLHVGETTALVLDRGGWTLDTAKSRRADLVSVRSAPGPGGAQKFVVSGRKTGQVELVFRRGAETFRAFIDVLK